ncbi:LolA family protein [Aestuariirhabdus litorea]|uniref:LolA family protein n=1 Tax=Aestuariirhabdus litorea TaxID=2528527 RepID=UPI0013E38019|nr:outer membrane lipoprotein carrier protein LolA [Aestuariirhabdus litorea]
MTTCFRTLASLLLLICVSTQGDSLIGGGGYGAGDPRGLQSSPLLRSLQEARTLRGQFTQSRTLPSLSSPLLSEGRFVLSREQGLLWLQQSPFTTRLVFSDQLMIQQVGDKLPTVLTREKDPVPFYFATLFRALLSGDWRSLQRDFQVSRTEQGLLLRPIQRQLRNAISEVRIEGQAQLERLTLVEKRGGGVEIEFRDLRGDTSPLTAEEQRLFRPLR